MEKRIGLELRGRKPEELTELNLDNCKSPNIEGLTDKFCNLESLSLISAGLTTLKGFPCLPKLRKLELSDNRISGGLNVLTQCTALKSLNFSGNRIKDLDSLKPLSELKNIKYLDLFHCDVTSVDKYREEVFKMLPTLVGLDGFDKNDHEVEDSDDDMNGVDEDDDGDDDEGDDDDPVGDEEEDDGEEDEDELGLSAIYKKDINDAEDEDGDFEGDDGQEDEEDDDDVDDEEEDDEISDDDAKADSSRGVKRKHEEEEVDQEKE